MPRPCPTGIKVHGGLWPLRLPLMPWNQYSFLHGRSTNCIEDMPVAWRKARPLPVPAAVVTRAISSTPFQAVITPQSWHLSGPSASGPLPRSSTCRPRYMIWPLREISALFLFHQRLAFIPVQRQGPHHFSRRVSSGKATARYRPTKSGSHPVIPSDIRPQSTRNGTGLSKRQGITDALVRDLDLALGSLWRWVAVRFEAHDAKGRRFRFEIPGCIQRADVDDLLPSHFQPQRASGESVILRWRVRKAMEISAS